MINALVTFRGIGGSESVCCINKSISFNIFFGEKDFKLFKDKINPDKYNGASLIGVNGISVKSHGNASAYAFSCAIDKCYEFIKNNINLKIKESFNSL